MYCVYCVKCIADDSLFCSYSGKNQEVKTFHYCHNCGNIIDKYSSFCTHCGNKQYYGNHWSSQCRAIWGSVKSRSIYIVKNRFFLWYVL